ncbi:MAG: response regulator [Clostridiales bacterium]|nr:response regulator [Clostridiales bacterium]
MRNRILIVDDSDYMRMMLKEILLKNHFVVAGEAEDGIRAIDEFNKLKPDLTLLDIMMPRMHGISVLQTIKKRFPSAKILMCSAMGQENVVVECIKTGAAGFIVKPFDAKILIETIKKNLK